MKAHAGTRVIPPAAFPFIPQSNSKSGITRYQSQSAHSLLFPHRCTSKKSGHRPVSSGGIILTQRDTKLRSFFFIISVEKKRCTVCKGVWRGQGCNLGFQNYLLCLCVKETTGTATVTSMKPYPGSHMPP